MTDLHCHILPCVDDGAESTSEALRLLKMEVAQDVDCVCLTPHLRDGMFTTPDEEITKAFEQLKERVSEARIPVRLVLSREYYYDETFLQLLESRQILSIGSRNVVLLEFSSSTSFLQLREAARRVKEQGYVPMIAHVERYKAVQKEPECLKKLIPMGVIIQINADSVLGSGGIKEWLTTHALLKQNLVHVIASDAHDPERRTIRLRKCREQVSKKFGESTARKLMEEIPALIIN